MHSLTSSVKNVGFKHKDSQNEALQSTFFTFYFLFFALQLVFFSQKWAFFRIRRSNFCKHIDQFWLSVCQNLPDSDVITFLTYFNTTVTVLCIKIHLVCLFSSFLLSFHICFISSFFIAPTHSCLFSCSPSNIILNKNEILIAHNCFLELVK